MLLYCENCDEELSDDGRCPFCGLNCSREEKVETVTEEEALSRRKEFFLLHGCAYGDGNMVSLFFMLVTFVLASMMVGLLFVPLAIACVLFLCGLVVSWERITATKRFKKFFPVEAKKLKM